MFLDPLLPPPVGSVRNAVVRAATGQAMLLTEAVATRRYWQVSLPSSCIIACLLLSETFVFIEQ